KGGAVWVASGSGSRGSGGAGRMVNPNGNGVEVGGSMTPGITALISSTRVEKVGVEVGTSVGGVVALSVGSAVEVSDGTAVDVWVGVCGSVGKTASVGTTSDASRTRGYTSSAPTVVHTTRLTATSHKRNARRIAPPTGHLSSR